MPKRKLNAVTGVSGSGKSSLVFDTIAAEAQRQLHETLPAFVRPGDGSHGGRIMFQGTPKALLDAPDSHTATHLRRVLPR